MSEESLVWKARIASDGKVEAECERTVETQLPGDPAELSWTLGSVGPGGGLAIAGQFVTWAPNGSGTRRLSWLGYLVDAAP